MSELDQELHTATDTTKEGNPEPESNTTACVSSGTSALVTNNSSSSNRLRSPPSAPTLDCQDQIPRNLKKLFLEPQENPTLHDVSKITLPCASLVFGSGSTCPTHINTQTPTTNPIPLHRNYVPCNLKELEATAVTVPVHPPVQERTVSDPSHNKSFSRSSSSRDMTVYRGQYKFDDLSNDILERIMIKMSIKEMVKATMINSKFRTIFSDKAFIYNQLSISEECFIFVRDNSMVCLDVRNLPIPDEIGVLDLNINQILTETNFLDFSFVEIVGCSSMTGLVCLLSSDRLIIWNPHTRAKLTISSTSVLEEEVIMYGFCNRSKLGESVDLFLMVCGQQQKITFDFHAMRWLRSELNSNGNDRILKKGAIYWEDFLYWTCDDEVLTFSLVDSTFHSLHVPSSITRIDILCNNLTVSSVTVDHYRIYMMTEHRWIPYFLLPLQVPELLRDVVITSDLGVDGNAIFPLYSFPGYVVLLIPCANANNLYALEVFEVSGGRRCIRIEGIVTKDAFSCFKTIISPNFIRKI